MKIFLCDIDIVLGHTYVLHEEPILLGQAISRSQTTSRKRLLELLDTRGRPYAKTYFVNGQLSTQGCNVIFGMIPTIEEVFGIHEETIPEWNTVSHEDVYVLLSLANDVLDDARVVVFVTSNNSLLGLNVYNVWAKSGSCGHSHVQNPFGKVLQDDGEWSIG